MTLEIFNCEQGSDTWRRVRCGIATASCFSDILARGEGKTRKTYMLKIAGEILTGEPMENYSNGAMERGKQMEAKARNAYAFMKDTDPQLVGFIRNGNKGASPDSLIGADGMLEIKTQAPHLLIETLLKDEFPPAHKAQCQGNLLVAERDWIDICVFYPGMPLFIKRAHRDVRYIAELSRAIDEFNSELHELVEKIRRYGEVRRAA